MSSKYEPTHQVINLLGGISETSRQLGVTRQAVFAWKNNGIPANKVLRICDLVNHQVSPEQLRPDIFTPTGER